MSKSQVQTRRVACDLDHTTYRINRTFARADLVKSTHRYS